MIKLTVRLFKRTNNIWYVELRRGVWRSLKTKDEREARIRFKELEREALRGKLIFLDKLPSLTLKDFSSEYLAWLEKNRAYGTYDRATLSLTKFKQAAGGERLLSSITDRDLDNHVDYCRQRGNRPSTINIEIRQIKAAFSKALQWKYLKENPFRGYAQIKYHKNPPQFLTKEQIGKVFEVIGGNRKYRLIFAFYVYTGARREEINKLTWSDIERGVIIFKGKGYRTRTVPLSPKLAEIMKEYPIGIGRLFNVTREQMSKQIKHYLRNAGLAHIRPHDLRHTFASHLVMEGVDLRTVQELLGHSSYSTTLIYAHLTQAHLKDAIKKLPY